MLLRDKCRRAAIIHPADCRIYCAIHLRQTRAALTPWRPHLTARSLNQLYRCGTSRFDYCMRSARLHTQADWQRVTDERKRGVKLQLC